MNEPRYEVIIWWSEEDKAFVAQAPELPGCMAHGYTKAEALTNINEAIQLWLDTAREFGREVPEPKGRLLICRTNIEKFCGRILWQEIGRVMMAKM